MSVNSRAQKTLTTNLHTGTSDTVADAWTAVGAVQHNPQGEDLILSLAYTKGTETGIQLQVVFPKNLTDSNFDDPAYLSTISGDDNLKQRKTVTYESIVDCTVDIPVSLKGRPYFRVYQQKKAGTASGTFTLKFTIFG